jgi:hypothetical protein
MVPATTGNLGQDHVSLRVAVTAATVNITSSAIATHSGSLMMPPSTRLMRASWAAPRRMASAGARYDGVRAPRSTATVSAIRMATATIVGTKAARSAISPAYGPSPLVDCFCHCFLPTCTNSRGRMRQIPMTRASAAAPARRACRLLAPTSAGADNWSPDSSSWKSSRRPTCWATHRLSALSVRPRENFRAGIPGWIIMFQTLLCRLNVGHHWQTVEDPKGTFRRRCTLCGKADRRVDTWSGHLAQGDRPPEHDSRKYN